MIWAGLAHADRAIIALAVIVAFFPIFSGALTGLKAVDPDLDRLFDLYGANPWQKLMLSTAVRIEGKVLRIFAIGAPLANGW